MTRLVLLAVAAACGACTFGMGSAYVGQWRARQEVDYLVCVEDAAGSCVETREVVSQVPARRYWGMIFTYPAIGVAATAVDGESAAAFRIETSAEYLRGRGRLAYGLRASWLLDAAGDHGMWSAPVLTPLVHYNLTPRFTLYGGAGYAPYTVVHNDEEGDAYREFTSFATLRALAGIEMVVTRREEVYTILSLEADTLGVFFGDVDYRSSGLVLHFGIFI